jgi:hypothetical protein
MNKIDKNHLSGDNETSYEKSNNQNRNIWMFDHIPGYAFAKHAFEAGIVFRENHQ